MMVHADSIWRKNGPMKTFWTMGFERLNGVIKRPSHIMNNFRNPQKTLAYRYQCHSLSEILEEESQPLFSNTECFNFDELDDDLASIIRPKISSLSSVIEVGEKFKMNSIEYRCGSFVVLDFSDQGYLFGKISCVVFENSEIPLLIVACYKTDVFDYHSFCHRIVEIIPSEKRVYEVSELLDYHPLDGLFIHGHTYIRMKYLVIKNSLPLENSV